MLLYLFLILSFQYVVAFNFNLRNIPRIPYRNVRRDTALKVSPSELAAFTNNGVASNTGINVDDIQNAVVFLAGVSYILWERRPKGSAKSELIAIKKSNIPNANLGVFAAKIIPKGTVIGEFPGALKSMDDALASKSDNKARQAAQQYIWAISDDLVLDPTDKNGALDLELTYLFGLYKIDTAMARINEPRMLPNKQQNGNKSYDCNVFTRIEKGSTRVEIIAERDIYVDEELLMDYGNRYDRTLYDEKSNDIAAEEKQAKLIKQREKEDAMTVQSIITDETSIIDQDTSNPDGFISKLTKQEKKTPPRQGILSPEDGAEMFRTVGSSMFTNANKEDQELLQDLVGKKTKGKKGEAILDPNETASQLLGSSQPSDSNNKSKFSPEMSDKELLESLFGAETMKSIQDKELTKKNRNENENTNNNKKSSDETDFISALMNDSTDSSPSSSSLSPASQVSNSVNNPSPPTTALSQEEAEELQQRVDKLTDEELERVFAKMRSAAGGKVFNELKKKKELKLPRATPKDNEIRQKYASELDAIETELENIYKDPMSIWEQLQDNPEPLLDGNNVNDMKNDDDSIIEKLIDN
eukprot:CAMPEP_0182432854 /NCGR_PEP_ID=MMETSP1167-20130531/59344_1 /TAXON_ID=2988 /ORGANISM="Mallomonas Sp, Strain CCMP3275" /LENGTH=585 /DNA_ID=CAMNT_0024620863 /DNA_START=48 /DNA_END=1802 /DNA_ORIENTATION=+